MRTIIPLILIHLFCGFLLASEECKTLDCRFHTQVGEVISAWVSVVKEADPPVVRVRRESTELSVSMGESRFERNLLEDPWAEKQWIELVGAFLGNRANHEGERFLYDRECISLNLTLNGFCESFPEAVPVARYAGFVHTKLARFWLNQYFIRPSEGLFSKDVVLAHAYAHWILARARNFPMNPEMHYIQSLLGFYLRGQMPPHAIEGASEELADDFALFLAYHLLDLDFLKERDGIPESLKDLMLYMVETRAGRAPTHGVWQALLDTSYKTEWLRKVSMKVSTAWRFTSATPREIFMRDLFMRVPREFHGRLPHEEDRTVETLARWAPLSRPLIVGGEQDRKLRVIPAEIMIQGALNHALDLYVADMEGQNFFRSDLRDGFWEDLEAKFSSPVFADLYRNEKPEVFRSLVRQFCHVKGSVCSAEHLAQTYGDKVLEPYSAPTALWQPLRFLSSSDSYAILHDLLAKMPARWEIEETLAFGTLENYDWKSLLTRKGVPETLYCSVISTLHAEGRRQQAKTLFAGLVKDGPRGPCFEYLAEELLSPREALKYQHRSLMATQFWGAHESNRASDLAALLYESNQKNEAWQLLLRAFEIRTASSMYQMVKMLNDRGKTGAALLVASRTMCHYDHEPEDSRSLITHPEAVNWLTRMKKRFCHFGVLPKGGEVHPDAGLFVEPVNPESFGAKAGIECHDQLRKLEDRPLGAIMGFRDTLRAEGCDQRSCRLEVLRHWEVMEIQLPPVPSDGDLGISFDTVAMFQAESPDEYGCMIALTPATESDDAVIAEMIEGKQDFLVRGMGFKSGWEARTFFEFARTGVFQPVERTASKVDEVGIFAPRDLCDALKADGFQF